MLVDKTNGTIGVMAVVMSRILPLWRTKAAAPDSHKHVLSEQLDGTSARTWLDDLCARHTSPELSLVLVGEAQVHYFQRETWQGCSELVQAPSCAQDRDRAQVRDEAQPKDDVAGHRPVSCFQVDETFLKANEEVDQGVVFPPHLPILVFVVLVMFVCCKR